MNRLTRIGLAAVLATVSAVAVSQAVTKAASQAEADKAIEARIANFKQINDLAGPLMASLRPNAPALDPALAATNMAKVAELAGKIPGLYTVDTRGFTGKTRALDSIFTSQADFKTKADALVAAANTLAEAGKTGDVNASRTALQGVGRTCAGCHDAFRGPPLE